VQLLVDFAISDQVFAKAKVPVTNSVNLWLGANVMLEYPLEEARDLLVCIDAGCMWNSLDCCQQEAVWRPHCSHVISLHDTFPLQAQNIKNCKENLKQNQRDLELVKDSITTTEVPVVALDMIYAELGVRRCVTLMHVLQVSMARVYNHDVSQRRGKKM